MNFFQSLITLCGLLSIVSAAAIPVDTNFRLLPKDIVRRDGATWGSWPLKPRFFILSLVRTNLFSWSLSSPSRNPIRPQRILTALVHPGSCTVVGNPRLRHTCSEHIRPWIITKIFPGALHRRRSDLPDSHWRSWYVLS